MIETITVPGRRFFQPLEFGSQKFLSTSTDNGQLDKFLDFSGIKSLSPRIFSYFQYSRISWCPPLTSLLVIPVDENYFVKSSDIYHIFLLWARSDRRRSKEKMLALFPPSMLSRNVHHAVRLYDRFWPFWILSLCALTFYFIICCCLLTWTFIPKEEKRLINKMLI